MAQTDVSASPEILVIQSAHRFGTIALNSGDVLINEYEAIIEDAAQTAEMKKLLNSGRVPHLRLKTVEDISKELASAQAKVAALSTLANRTAPRVGMTSSSVLPKSGQAASV